MWSRQTFVYARVRTPAKAGFYFWVRSATVLVLPVSLVVVYTLLKEWKWIREVGLVSVSACILDGVSLHQPIDGHVDRAFEWHRGSPGTSWRD